LGGMLLHGLHPQEWCLDGEDMVVLGTLDATAGSRGRIMKGDNFVTEGHDWPSVWDEDYEEP
jgi:hypothetical protein